MLMSTIYTYQENKRGYWEYDVKIIEKIYEDAYEIIERKMKPIRVPELEEFEVAIDIFDKKYILKGDDGRIMISEDDDGDLYVSVMNTERIKKEEREDKYSTRRRLRDCGQIQHLIFFNPTKFLHEFLSHQGNDYKSTAKGTSTQLEGGEKQFFILFQDVQF